MRVQRWQGRQSSLAVQQRSPYPNRSHLLATLELVVAEIPLGPFVQGDQLSTKVGHHTFLEL